MRIKILSIFVLCATLINAQFTANKIVVEQNKNIETIKIAVKNQSGVSEKKKSES